MYAVILGKDNKKIAVRREIKKYADLINLIEAKSGKKFTTL
jgi:hypothetical protein